MAGPRSGWRRNRSPVKHCFDTGIIYFALSGTAAILPQSIELR